VYFQSVLIYSFENATLDDTLSRAMRKQSEALRIAAVADGQDLSHASVYPNFALFDTPLEDMYGANVPRLRQIKADIDPNDVMGLAGGFKFGGGGSRITPAWSYVTSPWSSMVEFVADTLGGDHCSDASAWSRVRTWLRTNPN
jgi:hypothetical protein